MRKLKPFTLTAVIIILDQFTKMLVVRNIRLHTIGFTFFGDLLRIVHTRNPGIAFSMGVYFPEQVRSIVFTVLPLIVIAALIYFVVKSNELAGIQLWAVAGIVGGGFGNLIDRIFRPMGVVDFIDIKFFGLFGLERWPTFNIADSAVVICGIILVLSVFTVSKDAAASNQ